MFTKPYRMWGLVAVVLFVMAAGSLRASTINFGTFNVTSSTPPAGALL